MSALFTERLDGTANKLGKTQRGNIGDWPGVQLLAVKQAIITAAEQRVAGVPMQARLSARLGFPRSVSITWSGDAQLGIEFVGPELF